MASAEKDFLDHLRLIHFSIVLVAATIVVTSMDSGNQDTRRDLTTVDSLVDQQKPLAEKHRGLTYGNLEQLIRAATIPSGTVRADNGGTLTLRVDQADVTVTVSLVAPLGIVFHGDNVDGWSPDHAERLSYSDLFAGGVAEQESIVSVIPKRQQHRARADPFHGTGVWVSYNTMSDSMKSFQGFWNTLAVTRHGYVLRSVVFSNAYRLGEDAPGGSIPIRHINSVLRDAPAFSLRCKALLPMASTWTKTPKEPEGPDLYVAPLPITVDGSWASVGLGLFHRTLLVAVRPVKGVLKEVELEDLTPGDIVIVGDALYTHVPLNIQRQLLSATIDESHPTGKFEHSFPALSKYLDDLKYDGDVPIPLVDALVKRDSANSGGPVEMAGLKVSRAAIGFWGLVILVCFQLYFALHLRELIRRTPTADERLASAWIALYPGAWSAVVTALSASALPLLALVAAIRALPHIGALAAMVPLASVVLNVIAGVSILSIRNASR